jgi:hypothetical protein
VPGSEGLTRHCRAGLIACMREDEESRSTCKKLNRLAPVRRLSCMSYWGDSAWSSRCAWSSLTERIHCRAHLAALREAAVATVDPEAGVSNVRVRLEAGAQAAPFHCWITHPADAPALPLRTCSHLPSASQASRARAQARWTSISHPRCPLSPSLSCSRTSSE